MAHSGQFQPGHPRMGGRQKGTPNKRKSMLDKLEELRVDPIARLMEIAPQLELKEEADILLGILPYIYPKLKPAEESEFDAVERQIRTLEERRELILVARRAAKPVGSGDGAGG